MKWGERKKRRKEGKERLKSAERFCGSKTLIGRVAKHESRPPLLLGTQFWRLADILATRKR